MMRSGYSLRLDVKWQNEPRQQKRLTNKPKLGVKLETLGNSEQNTAMETSDETVKPKL